MNLVPNSSAANFRFIDIPKTNSWNGLYWYVIKVPGITIILIGYIFNPAEGRLEVLKDEVDNVFFLNWCEKYEVF